ncbi:toll-interacting protein B-like [Montipora foliosa]|uniref:toll-interacting protein B-like n=1 Tax=Montipora foliosa TaxID=591990 RepID=UPI0035F103C7
MMGTDFSKMAAESGTRAPRANVMTGDLPEDFLRISPGMNQASPVGQMIPGQPVAYFQPTAFMQPYQQAASGRLSITVQQAKLAKNYGVTRMDPYCRIRVGNHVFESPTAYNGSKNPRWNKLMSIPVQEGVSEIYVEIFDERAFSMDERIAWGLIQIKEEVLQGETVDDWYSLSGKQGDDKEGMINLVLAYRKVPAPPPPATVVYPKMPVMMVPQPVVPGTQIIYPGGYGPYQPVPTGQQQPPPQQQMRPNQRQQDVAGLKDMFPNMEESVIRSVLEASGGDVNAATTHLLSMTDS